MSKDIKKIIIGIPFVIIIGSLFHFLYDLLGRPMFLNLFLPISESVFEHLKLVIVPFTIYYFVIKKDDKDKMLYSAVINILSSILLILFMYYFYTSAFGFENVIVDILIFSIAIILSAIFSIHIYKYGKPIDYRISIAIIITIVFVSAVLSVYPPNLPMFKE